MHLSACTYMYGRFNISTVITDIDKILILQSQRPVVGGHHVSVIQNAFKGCSIAGVKNSDFF